MKTLFLLIYPLLVLALGPAAFGALRPAKDVVMNNPESQPTIFDISRPALHRFYVSVNTEGQAVKDSVSTTSAAPKEKAKN